MLWEVFSYMFAHYKKKNQKTFMELELSMSVWTAVNHILYNGVKLMHIEDVRNWKFYKKCI